jgi:hypothetical protein
MPSESAGADADADLLPRRASPRVDFVDASEVADAMSVPMPAADHARPPILDATTHGELPEGNGREVPGDDKSPEDIQPDPLVVEGDMSDTVARLVEEAKGWNKP